jgi:hypothetical protein
MTKKSLTIWCPSWQLILFLTEALIVYIHPPVDDDIATGAALCFHCLFVGFLFRFGVPHAGWVSPHTIQRSRRR